MNSPLISVVTPCFRGGRFLAEAIESVLSQTEKSWELILVDNNASEKTLEIANRYLSRYPQKIRLVQEREQGVASARNCGIREAIGKYIALLDDDDCMYPDRLLLQREAFEKFPSAVLCYGALDKVSNDNTKILEKNWKNPDFYKKNGMINLSNLSFKCIDPIPSTMMFEKKKAMTIGLFDKHFNPVFLEDTFFSLAMSEIGTFIEVDDSVIRYRMPNEEFLKEKRANNLKIYRLLLNQDYFYSKFVDMLNKKNIFINEKVQEDLKSWRSRWLREASFSFLSIKGGEAIARIFLLRALRENPLDVKSIKHLVRSFYSIQHRSRIYGKNEVPNEGIPSDISKKLILSIFKGNHHCEFC